jgi:hypothetical protein
MKPAHRRNSRATSIQNLSQPGANERTHEQAVEETAVRALSRRDGAARSGAIGRDATRSPSGFSLTVRINGTARLVPVVADSLERLVPLAEALELAPGGFDGSIVRAPWPALRVDLGGLANARGARQRIDANKAELLGRLMDALPRERRRLEPGLALDVLDLTHEPGATRLSVLVKLDAPAPACPAWDELAASACSALTALVGGQARSQPCELAYDRVRVGCSLDPAHLADAALRASPVRLAASVQRALRYLDFALSSPRTAAGQNQAVFGAISRVALALGHDPRPVISDGHAHATRFGGCASVVRFAAQGERVRAELELPLQLEPSDRQRAPGAEAAQTLARAQDTDDVRLLAACVGLASQLPALRAAIVH